MAVSAFAADPSGTYTFAAGRGGRGGGGGGAPDPNAPAPMASLVLAMKDGKLTGNLTSPGRGGGEPTTTAVGDLTMKEDMISFSVTQEFNGNTRVTKYSGKVTADAITGTVLAPGRGGAEPMPRDWVAKKKM
mgnify:FL=1